MKMTPKFLSSILAAVFLFALAMPSAFAGFEEMRETPSSLLDGVENFVRKSGLVDLKKEMWSKYGLLIKPFFKSRYTLTSNVFKAPDTDSDHTDNIWEFTPGFQFLHKSAKGIVGGAYEATFRYFTQFGDQNGTDQKFLVYGDFNLSEDAYIRFSEKLDNVSSVAGSSAFEPIDTQTNTVNAVAGYRMGKFTGELGYENHDVDYRTTIAERFNYNENKFDYRLYYQIAEKYRVYSGFRLGLLDYSKLKSRDTAYWEIPVGMEGTLPWGIMAAASVGVHHRNLTNSGRNDNTSVVSNISLAKSCNKDRTFTEIGFLRRPVESVFATATTYDEKMFYAGVKHLITDTLRGRLKTYVANRDFEDSVATGTTVLVGNRLFTLAGQPVVKRDDDVFGVDIGLDYTVRKWLILHMDYQYSRRNSNVGGLDYTENAFSIGSTVPL